jgi:LysR family glycine cleavage system transcriptional activator
LHLCDCSAFHQLPQTICVFTLDNLKLWEGIMVSEKDFAPMPSRRAPSLLALRAFEVAARRLSFTEAARELHVSQAAISRHVRTLEADLGRPLFRRLHRHVELTATGKQLARELLVAFSQIQHAVQSAGGAATRRLRISVEPSFAARWLVPRLGRFTAANPDIEIEFDSSDELRVIGRDTDIAIRFLGRTSRRPRGRVKKLFPLEGFPVVARRESTSRQSTSDSAVRGHRLLHDDDGTLWRSWFAAAGISGFEQAKHLHFNDSSLVVTAVLRGQGVALSAPLYLRSQLKSQRLVRLGRTPITFGDYWLLESADRASGKPRTAFVDWLTKEIERSSRVGDSR